MSLKKIKTTFTIEEVSEIAGVNSFTLRNWEDRYALFTPARDAKGRRIFSESDTVRAVVAADLTNRQHKIGKIASDLQNISDPHLLLRENVEGEAFRQKRTEAMHAMLEFNSELFQQNFMHVLGNYDVEFMADHFFYPMYREIEDLKVGKKITSFQFQFCQHQLATRLARLGSGARVPGNREENGRILVAGFPENQFEDSTLILQLMLDRYGWHTVYGGPTVVMDELQQTIDATKVDAVIIVGNNLSLQDYAKHEPKLEALSVPIIVGGRLALKLLAEGRASTFKIELTNLRPGPLARLLKFKLTASANDAAMA